MWTIGREGIALTILGLITGLTGGAIAARGLSSLLYGVHPGDVVTFVVTTTAVAAMAILITGLVAVRTLRIDPVAALRQDA